MFSGSASKHSLWILTTKQTRKESCIPILCVTVWIYLISLHQISGFVNIVHNLQWQINSLQILFKIVLLITWSEVCHIVIKSFKINILIGLQNYRFEETVGLQIASTCTKRKIRSDCPKSAPKFGKSNSATYANAFQFSGILCNIDRIDFCRYKILHEWLQKWSCVCLYTYACTISTLLSVSHWGTSLFFMHWTHPVQLK